MVRNKIELYIAEWALRGYPEDIPDEVPQVLADRMLAPSWRSIAVALLSNDLYLTSLGYSRPKTDWYSAFKAEEIKQRKPRTKPEQLTMI